MLLSERLVALIRNLGPLSPQLPDRRVRCVTGPASELAKDRLLARPACKRQSIARATRVPADQVEGVARHVTLQWAVVGHADESILAGTAEVEDDVALGGLFLRRVLDEVERERLISRRVRVVQRDCEVGAADAITELVLGESAVGPLERCGRPRDVKGCCACWQQQLKKQRGRKHCSESILFVGGAEAMLFLSHAGSGLLIKISMTLAIKTTRRVERLHPG